MGDARELLCFGLGFTARELCRVLRTSADPWRTTGTCRGAEKRDRLIADGVVDNAWLLDGRAELPWEAVATATHIVHSVPPDEDGDVVLDAQRDLLARARREGRLQWIGYLSTTGVYGDAGGAWVDETSPLKPSLERSKRRVSAERAWLDFGKEHDIGVHVFRLAGIYGPGSSILDRIRSGRAQRIVSDGKVFSRIHRDDICRVLVASIAKPNPGSIYNVCDDEPAASHEVTEYACGLSGLPLPPLVQLEDATLTPMGRSFWRDNRRVSNKKIHDELGVELGFPNYRVGIDAVWAAEQEATAPESGSP